jgi:hypothetical protein
MNSVEDQVRSATRAQAAAMREVRPLRLAPAPGAAPARPGSGARGRWRRGWMAPVTAAVAVIAVAVSLVIVRDIPNGPVVPPSGPASPSTVPPRYYVAISGGAVGWYAYAPLTSTKSVPPNHLVVGDTATGTKLATIAAPTGTAWTGVTAAADDRTFVALAEPLAGAPGAAGTWYLIKLTPRAKSPAKLTRLPIKPRPDVGAMALSGSGTELAVVTAPSLRGEKRLCVYSMATGDLLHPCWSTDYLDAFFMGLYAAGQLASALTWIDGDRAIAFPTLGTIRLPHSNRSEGRQTVRSLSLKSKGTNLMTDSQVIWSQTPANPNESSSCRGGYVSVSADGKTVSCAVVYASGVSSHSRGRWRLAWLTYPTSAAADRGGAPVVDYQLRIPAPTQPLVSQSPFWVDPSGTALLAGWSLGAEHFGVMSKGKFTPLPVPSVVGAVTQTAIAW